MEIEDWQKRKVYDALRNMKSRCYNTKDKKFKSYGERGIKVCDRWLDSLENFIEDVGYPQLKELSIDRFPNNDGDYEPGNCRWATDKEQANNTRQNVILSYNGKSQTVSAWAEETGIKSETIFARYNSGWSVEEVLTTPTRKEMVLDLDGQSHTVSQWSEITGISVMLIRGRIEKGWTVERTLNRQVKHIRNENKFDFICHKPITLDERTQSISEWSDETGISIELINFRLSIGLPVEECLSRKSKQTVYYIEYKSEIKTVGEWSKIMNLSTKIIYQRIGRGWTVEETFTIPIKNNKKDNI